MDHDEHYRIVCKPQLEAIFNKVDAIHKAMFVGNGTPALMVRVDRAEHRLAELAKREVSPKAILATIIPIMLTVITIAVMILFGGGCATSPQYSHKQPIVHAAADEPQDAVKVRGVHIGVGVTFGNQDCPGAVMDAETCKGWLDGKTTTLLLNNAATVQNVKDAIAQSAQGMTERDLLVVTVSGHGTQRQDLSGDEADWKDEGAVLYDRTWWDDEVWEFVLTLPPCRILLISDTCHSEGSWRRVLRAATFGMLDGRKYVQVEMDLGDARSATWGGQLIQIAGCRESGYSYGSEEEGGTLTQTLDKHLSGAESIQDWFDKTHAAVVRYGRQEPVLSTYNASEMFLRGRVFK